MNLKKNPSKIIHFCDDQTIAGETTLDCVILDGHILNTLDLKVNGESNEAM